MCLANILVYEVEGVTSDRKTSLCDLYHCDDKVSAHYHEVYCGVITFGQGFNSMVDWSAVVPFRALDDCVRKTWPMRIEKHCECSCAGLCQSLKTRSGDA
jgi:hypothetical protein